MIAAAVYTFLKLRTLERLRNNFMLQGQDVNIEEILSGLAVKIRDLERNEEAIEAAIAALRHELHFVVQKVGMVRFNSLSDQGGNLSFSIAILDKTHTGLVITSMHGREQNRVYAKPITAGQSDIALTEEETQAVNAAHEDWNKRINN
jgi:hypothetical protein